jgi:hypothetical protein
MSNNLTNQLIVHAWSNVYDFSLNMIICQQFNYFPYYVLLPRGDIMVRMLS